MKILIAITAPIGKSPSSGRQWQHERTNLAAVVKLIASRLEMGQEQGTIADGGGIVAHFKSEPEASENDEAA